MKRILSVLLTVCLLFTGAVILTPTAAEAASAVLPTASENLNVGAKSYSSLTATSDGYMRVYYDGSKVGIEYYDSSFNIKSKKSVSMELSRWGGFYAGSDAYYLVEGQNNTAENTSAEVIRVIKYDKNWNRLGAASVKGDSAFAHQIRYPFDSFSCEMDEYNGKLYVVTAHEGYVDSDYNQGHTGFLMLEIDEKTMTGKIVDADLWHSFAQYIEHDGSDLYILEQSEGSRYVKLSKGSASNPKRSTSIPVFRYGGVQTSAWSIPCYATVDGMALSSNNVLGLNTSIDQSKYSSASSTALPYNIYLTVTPKSNFTESATTVKQLTSYTGKTSFSGAKITKINDNRFMISWEVFGSRGTASTDDALSGFVLHYMFVDGNGNKLGSEYTAKAPISDCQPIVKGSKVVYCASSDNMVNFYTIDSSTGSFSKKSYRVVGTNAEWELKNGVLTISGTGAMSVDTSSNYRFSESANMCYSDDNVWKFINGSVKKIVIEGGITSIPERAFAYFSNLTEVEIQDGVKTIKKEAFYGCSSLSKITIPASVTTIGDDILWTGSYWIGSNDHVVRATIYAPSGSKAIQYAKSNDISYVESDLSTAVTGLKGTPTSTTVALSWNKLSGADGYKIEIYKNGAWSVYVSKTTATSYTVKDLDPNTIYKFRVTAIVNSKYGEPATITVKTATDDENIKPEAVTGFKATPASATSIKLTWNKSADADSYQVEIYLNSKWTKLTKTTGTSYTATGLTEGVSYKFRIFAYKGTAYSSSVTLTASTTGSGSTSTPTSTTKPDKVTNFKASTATANSISLTWSKVTGADSYQVEIYKNSKWTKLTKTTGTSYTATGLTKGTSYKFRIFAYKGTAYSSSVTLTASTTGTTSGSSSSTSTSSGTLAAVPTFKATPSTTSVKLSWTKATGADSYQVDIYKNGKWTKLTKTTGTSYTATGLTKNTSYKFRIFAFKGSAYSGSVQLTVKTGTTATVTATGKPSAVTGFKGTPSSTSVKMTWNKNTKADSYQIDIYKNGKWTKLTKTTGTSFTATGLTKGTTYKFRIFAFNGSLYSGSKTITVTL